MMIAAPGAAAQQAHRTSHQRASSGPRRACNRWCHRWGRIHHWHPPAPPIRWGPVEEHRATFYSVGSCDHGLGTLTASGQIVHFGVIASDYLPIGTHLRLTKSIMGKRDFYIEDTGAPFDVWLPCPLPISWDNPTLRFRIEQH